MGSQRKAQGRQLQDATRSRIMDRHDRGTWQGKRAVPRRRALGREAHPVTSTSAMDDGKALEQLARQLGLRGARVFEIRAARVSAGAPTFAAPVCTYAADDHLAFTIDEALYSARLVFAWRQQPLVDMEQGIVHQLTIGQFREQAIARACHGDDAQLGLGAMLASACRAARAALVADLRALERELVVAMHLGRAA